MKRKLLILILATIPYLLCAQTANEVPLIPLKEPTHILYLIGDAGSLEGENRITGNVLNILKRELDTAIEESSLVFLGDNIYPKGLPKEESPSRNMSEKALNSQLEIIKDYAGKAYMIPGNHDWNNSEKDGYLYIRRQEDYVEQYFEDSEKIKYYPNNACGDPVALKINKDLVFIFIDSEWWLQNDTYQKAMNEDCKVRTRSKFLKKINEIFVKYRNDQVVLFVHHPIRSTGPRAGIFPIKDHLFPLTAWWDDFYLPAPILGSVIPSVRSVYGSKEDLSHPSYRSLVDELVKRAKHLEIKLIFASGHEHGLEYFTDEDLRYIISGGGSKKSYIGQGYGESFALGSKGYVKLYFYDDDEVWLDFYKVDEKSKTSELVYRTEVYENFKKLRTMDSSYPSLEEDDKFITKSANAEYDGNGFKRFWMGEMYRDNWITPVKVPILNLEKEKGGLKPLKIGGGTSSITMRLKDSSEHQYMLRTVDKLYYKTFGEEYKDLKLFNIVQDMVSAHLPYGQLMLPQLSKAAGIYYTNPKLVYLKYQNALKGFNERIPEDLYFLEERPNGDWSHAGNFGNSSKIISYFDMDEKLRNKKTHFVDHEWVLKSRLFDMLIHDWDRHLDNWRWAVFIDGDSTYYRPIPRDRDMSFYKMNGMIPGYIAHYVQRVLLPFDYEIQDLKFFNKNASFFDRSYMNMLDWKAWLPIVEDFQANITDSIIYLATLAIPEEVRHFNQEEIISKLKYRRDHLKETAFKYYKILAKEVVIIGSDDKDLFHINYLDNKVDLIHWVKRKNKGNILKYKRTFFNNETKDIRIYGLDGKDEFVIKGVSENEINVKIIGGSGVDEINNLSTVNRLEYYDFPTDFTGTGEIKINESNDLYINTYDKESFKYNRYFNTLNFGYTGDDGFWFGLGQVRIKESWPHQLYKSRHIYNFSFAPGQRRFFHLNYSGDFNNAFGHGIDFSPHLIIKNPDYVNYFGMGNQSLKINPRDFYWVRMNKYEVNANITKDLSGGRSQVDIGPLYQHIMVRNTKERVTDDAEFGFKQEDFESKNFIGLQGGIRFGYLGTHQEKNKGFQMNINGSMMKEIKSSRNVYNLSMSSVLYLPIWKSPEITLANRVGYEFVWGSPEMHQYPSIGQSNYLRGFSNDRFRGERVFYHNIDVRAKIINWKNLYLPMEIGIIGGIDYGRVWWNSEDSGKYWSSATIGLSMDILYLYLFHPYFTFSEEEKRISFSIGYRF